MTKFRFLTKLSIFEQNFNLLTKFNFFNKISILEQNFIFWTKFRFLNKISFFDQNFDFWPNFDFWTNFRFSNKISIFEKRFDFWTKFHFWTEFQFLNKISIIKIFILARKHARIKKRRLSIDFLAENTPKATEKPKFYLFISIFYHLPTSKSLNSLNSIKSEIRFDFPVIVLPQLIIILFILVFFHWFLAISNLEKLKKLDQHKIWYQIWTPRHRFTLKGTKT